MLIDFAKVFDNISYGINLLERLHDYDIQGSTVCPDQARDIKGTDALNELLKG